MLELRYASYNGVFSPVSMGPCERFAGACKHRAKRSRDMAWLVAIRNLSLDARRPLRGTNRHLRVVAEPCCDGGFGRPCSWLRALGVS
jgi:hypothetical protein